MEDCCTCVGTKVKSGSLRYERLNMSFTCEYKYALTKLSSRSFLLLTDSEEVVFSVLNRYVCQDCRGGTLDDLLSSDCGCEFMLEENLWVTEHDKKP